MSNISFDFVDTGCLEPQDRVLPQSIIELDEFLRKGFYDVSVRDALVQMKVPNAEEIAEICSEKNQKRGNKKSKMFILAFTFEHKEAGRNNENPSVILNSNMISGELEQLEQTRAFVWGLMASFRSLPYVRFDYLYRGLKCRAVYKKDSVILWRTFTTTYRDAKSAERFLGVRGESQFGTFVTFKYVCGYDISDYVFLKNEERTVLLEPFQSLSIENVDDSGSVIDLSVVDTGKTLFFFTNIIPVPSPIPCYEYDFLVEGLKKHKEGKHGEAAEVFLSATLRGMRMGSLNYGNCLMFGVGVPKDQEIALEFWMNCGKIEENEIRWMRELSNSEYVCESVLDLSDINVNYQMTQIIEECRKINVYISEVKFPGIKNKLVKAFKGAKPRSDIPIFTNLIKVYFEPAMKRYNAGDYCGAIKLFEEAVDVGSQLACYVLSQFYLYGIGVEKDYKRFLSLTGKGGIIRDDCLYIYKRFTFPDYSKNMSLDLSCRDVGDSGASSISCALKFYSAIIKLDLSKNNISKSGALSLSSALELNSSLTSLNLLNNNIGDAGFSSLSSALKVNSSLTSLELGKNNISDSGISSLSSALQVNSTLTYLGLENNKLSSISLFSLSSAFEVNSSLNSLNLRCNNINPSGVFSLSSALQVNSSLKELNLESNNIGDPGTSSLASALKVNSSLTSLKLNYNNIGEPGASSLASALKVNSSLAYLELGHNQIGESGTVPLADALKSNSSLLSLDLQFNFICNTGACSLAEALKVNSSITSLDLSHDRIGEIGGSALASAVKVNSSLIVLKLGNSESLRTSWNCICDGGACSMGAALKTNLSITSLNLQRNNICDSGASALSGALKVNSSITELNLGFSFFLIQKMSCFHFKDNSIGDLGATSVSLALKVNSSVTSLVLQYNIISEKGTESLAKAMESNVTITRDFFCPVDTSDLF